MTLKILRVIAIMVFIMLGFIVAESKEKEIKPNLVAATMIVGVIAGILVLTMLFT